MEYDPWSLEAIHNSTRNLNTSYAQAEVDEQARIDADVALNRNKVERADARALRDQIMLDVLMRSSA